MSKGINACDKKGNSPLLLAAEDGHLEVVKELLERGANTNIRRQKGRGHSPLEVAAMNGHAEVVKALIDYGADVNSKDSAGYTALMIAAGCGQAETAKAPYSLWRKQGRRSR